MSEGFGGPCCGHSRVSWRTKQIEGGLTTGWWECDSGCGMRFTTVPHAMSIQQEPAESRAVLPGQEMKMKATRREVYIALDSERDYQVKRAEAVSREGSGEHLHSLGDFALYIEDYMQQLRQQLSRIWTPDGGPAPEALNTLRKVTALGVAAMEQHGAPLRAALSPDTDTAPSQENR